MSIHLHHVRLFKPEEILARNPSSTSISTKKGEEIHGLLARYRCKARVRRRAGAWREAYGGVRGGRTGLKAHGGCCCGAGEKGVT
ncbi:hypothetical protein ES332_A05G076800v1 [Gossypium tomentosum]|uniref:Uncharacterized protein n=1 Tax=Gossypium tomentosum TaxID=34277 RepID=A0A5D2QCP9_GOSTO|nr:hypothetical protein ES332_A05G076800v1 [Gossypium tomentosum]